MSPSIKIDAKLVCPFCDEREQDAFDMALHLEKCEDYTAAKIRVWKFKEHYKEKH